MLQHIFLVVSGFHTFVCKCLVFHLICILLQWFSSFCKCSCKCYRCMFQVFLFHVLIVASGYFKNRSKFARGISMGSNWRRERHPRAVQMISEVARAMSRAAQTIYKVARATSRAGVGPLLGHSLTSLTARTIPRRCGRRPRGREAVRVTSAWSVARALAHLPDTVLTSGYRLTLASQIGRPGTSKSLIKRIFFRPKILRIFMVPAHRMLRAMSDLEKETLLFCFQNQFWPQLHVPNLQ